MKYILLLLFSPVFIGCGRRSCKSPEHIYAYIDKSWKSFDDSFTVIKKYQTGANAATDSTIEEVGYAKDTVGSPFRAFFNYNFEPGWDYIIVFLPSGILKKITEISVDHSKAKRNTIGWGEEGNYYCGWQYKVDGTPTYFNASHNDEGDYAPSQPIYLYE